MDDTDKTTPGVDGPTAEKTPLTSTFLTREEYEKVGDDPEPLPKGFEVIDGTGVFPRVEEADGPDMGGEAVEKSTGAVATVRSFFSQGAHAVRQVGIAKKAHDAAKEELAGLEVRILERTAELERRRDVTARFDDIIAAETARKATSEANAEAAEKAVAVFEREIEDMKDELRRMRDADALAERRLKAAVEAAEAKEASARESGARLQRRLDDARRNLERAEAEHETGIKTAKAAISRVAALVFIPIIYARQCAVVFEQCALELY